jgi:hypothetical protein
MDIRYFNHIGKDRALARDTMVHDVDVLLATKGVEICDIAVEDTAGVVSVIFWTLEDNHIGFLIKHQTLCDFDLYHKWLSVVADRIDNFILNTK